ncbi:hypothetical protein Acr_24g0006480 [Actinidia rufa]|uniref:Uncharacterized protein n=1 Tax=Actinidia rufa TaxID=165716 RepID=A0A7J0GUJ8_9ERIC|nr:hypothetical protein Acr_24g0006480 [Actinidia rufa]
MSPKLSYIPFAHREKESSAGTLATFELTLEDPEVHNEPPKCAEVPLYKNITKGLEVCKDNEVEYKVFTTGFKSANKLKTIRRQKGSASNRSSTILALSHGRHTQSYLGPYLLCIHPSLIEALFKIHEGIYRLHSKGRSLALSPNSEVLVTLHAKGCPSMYKMLAFLPSHSSTNYELDPSDKSMAICQWGMDIVGGLP